MRLLIAVFLSIVCLLPAHARANSISAFSELLERHQRTMKPLSELFATQPVRIEYLEGNPADGKRVVHYWQQGLYRTEFHWLGFTEVFGFDGKDSWYGSQLNLPYTFDLGAGLDITPELVENFGYLKPDQLPYITPPDDVPLGLANKYSVLRYAPPGMSEALLLLDPFDFRLAGMLQSTDSSMDDATLYRLTTFEEWSPFAACTFPAVIHLRTLTAEGEEVRERFQTTQQVSTAPMQTLDFFERKSSPQVPAPKLPQVPYSVPFSYLHDTVVLKCTGPDGRAYRFELDTGATVGLLRRDVVRRLKLTPVGEEEVTGHGGTAKAGYVRVEGMKLGDLELPPFPAAVLSEERSLDDSLSKNNVAGLLGTFILNNFVVQLDYRRRKMTLWEPNTFDPKQDLGAGYYSIPCVRDRLPYVMVDVDSKLQGGAFFNTGAQQYFTLSAWAVDRAGLNYEVSDVTTGVTIHGMSAFGIIHPGEVRLGDLVIKDPLTHLELLAPGETPNPHSIASFGNAFFHRNKVTFDLFKQCYYIETM